MLDFTSFWTFFKKNDNMVGQLLIILVIFAAGWYFGQLTSPYNNSTPIVFEDRACSACSGSGGSTQELEALRDAGSPQVAAAVTSRGEKTFVSSVNSDLYHHYTCPSVSRIKPANQEWF